MGTSSSRPPTFIDPNTERVFGELIDCAKYPDFHVVPLDEYAHTAPTEWKRLKHLLSETGGFGRGPLFERLVAADTTRRGSYDPLIRMDIMVMASTIKHATAKGKADFSLIGNDDGVSAIVRYMHVHMLNATRTCYRTHASL